MIEHIPMLWLSQNFCLTSFVRSQLLPFLIEGERVSLYHTKIRDRSSSILVVDKPSWIQPVGKGSECNSKKKAKALYVFYRKSNTLNY